MTRPNPWVRVPAALVVVLTLVVGGWYLATHATSLDDKARALAESNIRDVLITVVGNDVEVVPALARAAARDVAFQDDSGCEVASEIVVGGNSVAEAISNAQTYIDRHFIGVPADVRAEYGAGYALDRGVRQQTGSGVNDFRYLPSPYVAFVVIIHCAAPVSTGPSGMGT